MKTAQESHWRLASNPRFLVAHYLDSPLSSEQQGTATYRSRPYPVLDNTFTGEKHWA